MPAKMKMIQVPAAIIGAGPAGLAAAVYLQRAGHSPLVIEKNKPGGLLRNANLVENYPGFPGGIAGPELAALMHKQAKSLGVRFMTGPAESARRDDGSGDYHVKLARRRIVAACVILATGTRPLKPQIPGLRKCNKRVYYETADIPAGSVRGKRYAVIGGGDAAFDYALGLKKRGAVPFIVCRGASSCLGLLRERAQKMRIPVFYNCGRVALKPNSGGLFVAWGGKEPQYAADFALIACGRVPSYPSLSPGLLGALRIHPAAAKVPGFFVAGDVARGLHRQASIAAGDGVSAAMRAAEFLEARR